MMPRHSRGRARRRTNASAVTAYKVACTAGRTLALGDPDTVPDLELAEDEHDRCHGRVEQPGSGGSRRRGYCR